MCRMPHVHAQVTSGCRRNVPVRVQRAFSPLQHCNYELTVDDIINRLPKCGSHTPTGTILPGSLTFAFKLIDVLGIRNLKSCYFQTNYFMWPVVANTLVGKINLVDETDASTSTILG